MMKQNIVPSKRITTLVKPTNSKKETYSSDQKLQNSYKMYQFPKMRFHYTWQLIIKLV